MTLETKYRLVRDSLGFYNQVPIVAEDAIEPEVVSDPVLPKSRPGRPRTKPQINAEFEVDV